MNNMFCPPPPSTNFGTNLKQPPCRLNGQHEYKEDNLKLETIQHYLQKGPKYVFICIFHEGESCARFGTIFPINSHQVFITSVCHPTSICF